MKPTLACNLRYGEIFLFACGIWVPDNPDVVVSRDEQLRTVQVGFGERGEDFGELKEIGGEIPGEDKNIQIRFLDGFENTGKDLSI